MAFWDRAPKQEALLVAETGDVYFEKYLNDTLYMVEMDSAQAWELDPNQQAMNDKGICIQVISERSKKPVQIFQNKPLLTSRSTDTIANQKQDAELAFMQSKSHRSSMLLWLGIITAILAVTISIVVLVSLARGGNLAAVTVIPAFSLLNIKGKRIKNKQREDKVELESEDILTSLKTKPTGLVDCIIFVEDTRHYSFERIDRNLIPEGSIERRYNKKPIFLLTLNEKLHPVEPDNEIKDNDMPQDLFLALQYEREVNEMYGLSEGLTEKIKLGIFVGLIIALLFVLFLIGSIVAGGGNVPR